MPMLEYRTVKRRWHQILQVFFLLILNYFVQGGFSFYVALIVHDNVIECKTTPWPLQVIAVFAYFFVCWEDMVESLRMSLFIFQFPVNSSLTVEVRASLRKFHRLV